MQNIMLMKMPIILAFIFLLIVSPVIAVDESGQYIYGGAVGGHSCPFFASIMVKANKYNIPSPEYAFQTSSHTNYISGFQTGYNLQTKDTCNIFNNYDEYQLLNWLHNYCRENPLEKFSGAVVALSLTLHSKRLRSCRKWQP